MGIMNTLFDRLSKEEISYCHFKSNQHIKESFLGMTDFDVLVDKEKIDRVTVILTEIGAKRFESPYINNYPGIENWLVFDPQTGIIYHLHLHYQLLTGTAHVKEFLLPWYPIVLENAVYDEEYRLYICEPSIEFILLVTRIVLKAKSKQRLKAYAGQFALKEDMQAELEYLLDEAKDINILKFAKKIYGEQIAEIFIQIYKDKEIKAKTFCRLNKLLKESLEENKRYKNWEIFCINKVQTIYSIFTKVLKRLGKMRVLKKISAKGGIAIAFIGVDGSGKSTMSKEISKWLSKKIECQNLYLGTGDGAKDIRIKILKLVQKLGGSVGGKSTKEDNKNEEQSREKKKITLFSNPTKYASVFIKSKIVDIVASKNYKKLQNMNKYRINGGNCVMDRYPQLEKIGINDGLKIEHYARQIESSVFSKMASRERKNMSIVETVYPDVIFRLNISLETCISRKEEHKDTAYFEKKIADLSELKYEKTELIDIDAEQSFEEELLQIKKLIWERL